MSIFVNIFKNPKVKNSCLNTNDIQIFKTAQMHYNHDSIFMFIQQ